MSDKLEQLFRVEKFNSGHPEYYLDPDTMMERALKETFNNIALSLRHSKMHVHDSPGMKYYSLGGWEETGGVEGTHRSTVIRLNYFNDPFDWEVDRTEVQAWVEQPERKPERKILR